MDNGIKLLKNNPKKSANFISKLTFFWIGRLFFKSNKKKLKINDLYKNLPADESENLGNRLERNWVLEMERAEKKRTKPNLLRALSSTFLWDYATHGLFCFIQYGILKSCQPLVLWFLIQLFAEDPAKVPDRFFYMWMYGGCLGLLTAVVVLIHHHVNMQLYRVGMRCRIACSSLLYRKTLRLSKASLGHTASGQIVNLLSNDVQRFDYVAPILHFIWITPIQVCLITYFIYEEVQISAFAGVLGMILMTFPVQVTMGKLSSVFRLKVAARTDHRVKLMNEIISGVQVIKMYVWEKPFEKMVHLVREHEIKILTYTSYLRGVYASFAVFTERTALFLSVLCYYLLGNEITAQKIFSLAQFFNILQLSMAIFFPLAVSMGAESLVSIKRLEEVLLLSEKEASDDYRYDGKEIILKNVYASWTPISNTLRDVNFKIREGTLCAVVGPVGSGKSSLLQLCLGELSPQIGSLKIGMSVSYASQEPWLFVSTVRKNILFGLEYDRSLYAKVVKVCALEKDFELFPNGDKTYVGERGVSLSGGQRARINLARAVYREADIYLLDDPLSAVDTHVANHLFDECINGYLKQKTRILVTHQLQFLKNADYIVVLNEGGIEAQGTYAELCNSELDFTKYLQVTAEEPEAAKPELMEVPVTSGPECVFPRSVSIYSSKDLVLDEEENPEEVTVFKGTSAYIKYAKAGGSYVFLGALVALMLAAQVVTSAGDYWLGYWINSEMRSPLLGDYTYLYVYSGLIVGCIVLMTLRSVVFFKMSMRASENLHSQMFGALLKAPMRFFNVNPSGRVLNRFSKDMGAIDDVLPRVSMETIQILLVMCGILVIVIISNYYMAIAVVVLLALFVKVCAIFVITAKDMKHLEGITKSPMFSHMSATLNGIVTIRASNAQDVLKAEFDQHQNVHTSAWYLTIALSAACGLWLDALCVIFLFSIICSFIAMNEFSEVSGSRVGLAISQSLILTGMLQYGMMQLSQVINQMTCVERILDYTKLEKEGEDKTGDVKEVDANWPDEGKINFNAVFLRYTADDPPVLKDLNFTVKPGDKVGIVGRTGAGKSSIISALFRLAPLEGKVYIDNVDTQNVSLENLRQNMSIIPQEPVLFSASMRYNLDPFEEFDDEAIWNVLKEVELKECVSTLNFMIDEGGTNFSVGQRQLICLARAILRNNKILVLDEATANVDHKTDALIQSTIRKKFESCTVLTIAHRLNTIMDSDKVLVMQSGELLEYDHPYKLLENPNGHFSKMVAETGKSMTRSLRETAEEAYLNRYNENLV